MTDLVGCLTMVESAIADANARVTEQEELVEAHRRDAEAASTAVSSQLDAALDEWNSSHGR